MSSPKRRRWLTALGLFLATAVGGVVAYLLARRARKGRQQRTEEASVTELSARLRLEAAAQEMRMRRRPGRMHGPLRRRRQSDSPPSVPPEAGPPA